MPLPYLTAELPGIQGELKVHPEDFVVEEIPAYQPSGEGEHLFLWVEKRNVAAEQLTRHFVRALRCGNQDVGTAGMKDRWAVTRQFVSIPAKFADQVPSLETDSIRILRSERHGNKLRTGHLRGNRFEILVRKVADTSLETAQSIAAELERTGFPNFFGDQRFGRDRETLELGLDLLANRKTPRDIPYSRRKFLLRLAISSVQSQLFNECLAARIIERLHHTVFAGDVMEVVASGGKFLAEDVPTEQTRFDQRETMLTGPLFGPKMLATRGIIAEREAAILHQSGLQLEQFATFKEIASGSRRPYFIHPQELKIEPVTDTNEFMLKFSFTLPAGVYATTLLREFQKLEGMDSEPAPEESDSEAE